MSAPAHASGWVNASRTFEYAYPFGAVPSVTINVPGRYLLELRAQLVFADERYPVSSTSVASLVIDET